MTAVKCIYASNDLPQKIADAPVFGFQFQYPELAPALAAILPR
jgi:hypothetical protein